MSKVRAPTIAELQGQRFRSGRGLYVVELFHPRSWRLAMSVEFCANACPTRKQADAAAKRYEWAGFPARVVYYQARRVLRALPSAPAANKRKRP